MYKIAFALFSVAAALPLEDTVEVKEAKEAFHTVYKSVEAGEHVNLMPVNNDVQAPQISNMYLDDTADVAEAKEAFHAEFKNVEADGQTSPSSSPRGRQGRGCCSKHGQPCPPCLQRCQHPSIPPHVLQHRSQHGQPGPPCLQRCQDRQDCCPKHRSHLCCSPPLRLYLPIPCYACRPASRTSS